MVHRRRVPAFASSGLLRLLRLRQRHLNAKVLPALILSPHQNWQVRCAVLSGDLWRHFTANQKATSSRSVLSWMGWGRDYTKLPSDGFGPVGFVARFPTFLRSLRIELAGILTTAQIKDKKKHPERCFNLYGGGPGIRTLI